MKDAKDKLAVASDDRRRALHSVGADSPRLLRDPPEGRQLLDRILDTPHLEHAIPRLQPELLHRVIETCGLEDCAELVSLATPGQLARVFDLDVWGAARKPGADERFDADRFGVWLDVLVEPGADLAARKLAAMDPGLIVAGLAHHVLVFDRAAVAPCPTTDGGELVGARTMSSGVSCDVGGYVVVAKRTDSWDAIVAVLTSLGTEHHDYFDHVMRGCRRLSNSAPEVDGLDDLSGDADQVMFDVACDREQRRERQGYVTPAQARAFLEMARQLQLEQDCLPTPNPVARAYFRSIDRAPAAQGVSRSSPPDPGQPPEPLAAVLGVLVEAGIVVQQPRGLLQEPRECAPRFERIQEQMQVVLDGDHAAYSARIEEMGYLANTLMAGCSIQGRAFTAQESWDAAVAICNLGLENWPRHWFPAKACEGSSVPDAETLLPENFLAAHDLVCVFQVGWRVLYDRVTMHAAERLIEILGHVKSADCETQSGLDRLRAEMARHWRGGAPWRARTALDVIAILDMPAWAALLGLIDELPVIHAAVGASSAPGTRAINASAFEFISTNSQMAAVRKFMASLPETLSP